MTHLVTHLPMQLPMLLPMQVPMLLTMVFPAGRKTSQELHYCNAAVR